MIKLKRMYNGFQAGTVVDFGRGVELLLIERGIAEPVQASAPAGDADGDGKAEAGEDGVKKAFSAPPILRRKTK